MGIEHLVQLGETFRTIALSYGIAQWRAIYDHPRNAQLRRSRPDPDVLHPGDRVWIEQPDEAAIVYAAPVPCRTGNRYLFIAPPTVPLVVRTMDRQGERLSNRRYEIRCGTTIRSGTTDGDGFVRERVPMAARHAELRVWLADDDPNDQPSWRLTLELNAVHPLDTIEGVKARLANLGYFRGPIDAENTPELRAAVSRYQRERGLTVTGEADSTVRNALREHHRT